MSRLFAKKNKLLLTSHCQNLTVARRTMKTRSFPCQGKGAMPILTIGISERKLQKTHRRAPCQIGQKLVELRTTPC